MRHLIAETGPDKVVIGTDYPFPWNRVPVDHILSTPGLSDDDKIAILGGTAAKLLGIDSLSSRHPPVPLLINDGSSRVEEPMISRRSSRDLPHP